jgi:phosphoglucomutase
MVRRLFAQDIEFLRRSTPMGIRFGTSGWRAIIAEDFTFANVRHVTRAICRYLANDAQRRLIVGHDTRFLGERFAEICAEEAATYGFEVLSCAGPTPTPAIASAICDRRASGGINFTASHNPPEYNGMKFSTADGAPALPDITRRIEELIEADDGSGPVAKGRVDTYDAHAAYFASLSAKVRFDLIARARARYAYDPLWGTGRGYLDALLREHGLEVITVHDWRDVLFGGRAPEADEDHLAELRAIVRERGCALGLATDGDADRFGILDGDGTFITPNQIIALLFDYLAESRGWTGGVARSVATSHLVDRVAQARGLPVYETPVGFKYIGELIIADKIILGGEESAGLSIRGHYPEKDGILACLLAAEAVAARGVNLREQLEEIYARVGRVVSRRTAVRLTPNVREVLAEKLKRDVTTIGGRRVAAINRLDGTKFIFEDGSWLLMRPSGTEPLVRIYAESESERDVEVLLEQGRKYILE